MQDPLGQRTTNNKNSIYCVKYIRNLFLRPRKVSTSKRNNDNNENTNKDTNNSIDIMGEFSNSAIAK